MEYVGWISFIGLALYTVAQPALRKKVLRRSLSDWIIDGSSLAVHFIVLPLIQVVLVHKLFSVLGPQYKGVVPGAVLTSVLMYLAVDYAWYWNHRLFHAETPLWNLHKTHHHPAVIDVFITARNAFVTHFAMVYLWLIGLATYLLDDPSVFLGLVAFGTIINFWGHTDLNFSAGSSLERTVSALIVTPRDHFWHHSRENSACNFGTVLTIWDRMHGTLYRPGYAPGAYGSDDRINIARQLIWPF